MKAHVRQRDIQYWPTRPRGLESVIVPPAPEGWVIRHMGQDYSKLSDAEEAARNTFRVITYGPREQQP